MQNVTESTMNAFLLSTLLPKATTIYQKMKAGEKCRVLDIGCGMLCIRIIN